MQRVLEPEVMDTWEEATAYDSMDFTEVNTAFTQGAIKLGPQAGLVLDAGTGTARIPVLLCQDCPQWQVIGIDLAANMLSVGSQNVKQSNLQSQILLELMDAKHLTYHDAQFDMVLSNSLVHHLPEPLQFLLELKRVLKPNGAILIRDLIRPLDQKAMDAVLKSTGEEYDDCQRMLFRNSLQASFSLAEVNELVQRASLENVKVYQSSGCHWTVERAWR